MTVVHLLITLLEHFGLVALATFLLLSWGALQKLFLNETSSLAECSFTAFFGVFGIVGTCAGTPVTDALANSRASGIGLGNITQRLGHVYGPRYRLKIRRTPQEGVAVRTKIRVRSYTGKIRLFSTRC